MQSSMQASQGIPKSLLTSLPLTALNLLCHDLAIDLWAASGLQTIGDLFYISGQALFLQILQNKVSFSHRDGYKYLRIRHALQVSQPPPSYKIPLPCSQRDLQHLQKSLLQPTTTEAPNHGAMLV